MARGSSINFKKSSAGFEHNDRTEDREPKHLLPEEFRQRNECDRSAIEARELLKEMVENAKEKYQERTGQKCQAKILSVEAVINLEAHHTLKDVENINEYLEQKHGLRAVQSSIHRDEGHINDEGKPEYNLHAHVVYCNLDKEGKTILKGLEKADLRELQTFVSEALQMTRGQSAEITKAKHKSPQEFRHEKTLATNKDLKAEIAQLREQLKERGATRSEYAELEQLNKELKEQIKAKDLTIDQLKVQLQEAIKVPHEPINTRMISNLQSENEMLKLSNTVLERKLKEGEAPKIDPIKLFEEIEEITKPISHTLGEKELIKKDANGQEIDPIDELVRASTTTVEEKGLIYTTTKQVFDKDVFIQKVKERENEHQKLHKEKNGFIKALEYSKERMKTALKSVFEQFTGKSLPQVQKERTELLNAQKEQQRKEREIDRPKSRGLER